MRAKAKIHAKIKIEESRQIVIVECFGVTSTGLPMISPPQLSRQRNLVCVALTLALHVTLVTCEYSCLRTPTIVKASTHCREQRNGGLESPSHASSAANSSTIAVNCSITPILNAIEEPKTCHIVMHWYGADTHACTVPFTLEKVRVPLEVAKPAAVIIPRVSLLC